ncbi:MAG: glycoside hydrolase family 18 protein [Candidatus Marinimicrobia bacterium]|nr:glycoside hydrolase family 18 protein [Candidatus Neomarinimicrobiota bacterium]
MKKYIVIAVLGSVFFSCSSSFKQISDSADPNGQSLKSFDVEPPSSLVATEGNYQTNPIDPSSVMMGYLIEGYKPTEDQFKKMTHVSISFLRAANSEGDIKMTNGWENIDEVIAAAHSNNVKVLISFGGGEFKVTSELMGVKENRQNLIRNIIDFMIKHNLDGFDCDWEPSWINNKAEMEAINNAITNYYIVFIKEFREALDIEFGKGNKLFTAAILNANNIWYSDEKQIAHFPQNGWWNYLDWVSLMNYDNDVGEKHATFESVFGVNGSVAYWTTFGIPHKKIVTGIPFYARSGWGSEWLFYKQVIEMNPAISDTLNFIIHNKNDSGDKVYGFNGTKVAVQKVAEGKNLNLAGIMFWQLAGDVPSFHKKSLLKAMHEEFIK